MPKVGKRPVVPVDANGKCPEGQGNYLPPRDGKCYFWDKVGCGDAEVVLNPEKTDITTGETIKISYTYSPDLDLINGWINNDSGWTRSTWTVAGQQQAGNPPSIQFKQDTPGTYEVQLSLETYMKSCRPPLKASTTITVHAGTPPPPPPPPPPTCQTGYVLKDGTCVLECQSGYVLKDGACVVIDNDDNGIPDNEECGAGKVKDANGNCVDDGDNNGIPDQEECGEHYIKNASGECVCDTGYILKDGKCLRDTDGDGTHDDDDDDIDGDGKDNNEDDDIDGDGIKNDDDKNPYIHDLMYAKALQSQYMGDVFYKEPTATKMGDEGTASSQLPSTPLLVMGGLLVAFFLMPKKNK